MENIPWSEIRSRLNSEPLSNSKKESNIEQWLSDKRNAELYDEISALWMALMAEGAQYESNADQEWENIQRIIKKERVTRRVFNIKRPYLFASACVAVLSLFVTVGLSLHSWNKVNSIHQSFSSLNGKASIVLPDGTHVWLNKGTELAYDASPFARNREVSLQGEAFFDVVKNAQRPFVVHSGDLDVIVRGTKFNVRSIRGEDRISVTLTEGKVDLKAGEGLLEMNPGDKVLYDCINHTIEKTAANTAIPDNIWMFEKYHISHKTLRETADILSKWFDVKIIVASSIDDHQSFTISITSDDSLENVLEDLTTISGYKLQISGNNEIKITQ